MHPKVFMAPMHQTTDNAARSEPNERRALREAGEH